jgi:choline transport protein
MRDASRVVPTSLSAGALLNALLGLAAVLTLAFSLPAPLASLGASPGARPPASAAAPFIAAFAAATRSAALAAAAAALLVALLFGAALSAQAAACRHVVRLARDDGAPLAPLWAAAAPRWSGAAAPPAALLLALGATVALALLHLGADAALGTGVGVFVAATASAYLVGIACALLHRLRGGAQQQQQEVRPSWSLGRLSVPASAFSLAYLAIVLGFSFPPLARSGLAPATMNWSAVVWATAMLFASLVYGLHGRYVFKGPSGMFGLPFEDPASFRPESYLPTYDE